MKRLIFRCLFNQVERDAIEDGLQAALTINGYDYTREYAAKDILKHLYPGHIFARGVLTREEANHLGLIGG